MGALLPVPPHVAGAGRRGPLPGPRLLGTVAAAAAGTGRRPGARQVRAGAADEGRQLRPVQGAADLEADEELERGGEVAASAMVLAESRHHLPSLRCRDRLPGLPFHTLRLKLTASIS